VDDVEARLTMPLEDPSVVVGPAKEDRRRHGRYRHQDIDVHHPIATDRKPQPLSAIVVPKYKDDDDGAQKSDIPRKRTAYDHEDNDRHRHESTYHHERRRRKRRRTREDNRHRSYSSPRKWRPHFYQSARGRYDTATESSRYSSAVVDLRSIPAGKEFVPYALFIDRCLFDCAACSRDSYICGVSSSFHDCTSSGIFALKIAVVMRIQAMALVGCYVPIPLFDVKSETIAKKWTESDDACTTTSRHPNIDDFRTWLAKLGLRTSARKHNDEDASLSRHHHQHRSETWIVSAVKATD